MQGKSEIKKRISRLQKELRRNGIGIAIISSLSNPEPNCLYYSGRDIEPSLIFIPKKGNSKIFVSKMEYARAKRFLSGFMVEMLKKPVFETIGKHIRKHKAETIGINMNIVSVSEYKMLKKAAKRKKFTDIGGLLQKQRAIKSAFEIKQIKKACKISDEIFKKVFLSFGSFRTEEDVRMFMAREAKEKGCEPAFEPLVASGTNSGYVHYLGDNVKLKKGFCFIDFGVKYRGYNSDTTRVVYIAEKGKEKKPKNPTYEETGLYLLLKKAQKEAVSMVRPEARCSDIDRHVRNVLGKYKENFTHNLGHGVGIQIHEQPNLHELSQDVLKPGMVLTIEPGIYFPGKFGIRIEDTVLVTKSGRRVLTNINRDLLLIRR